MAAQIRLPGRAEPVVIPEPGWAASYPPPSSRRVYAAAHVAAAPVVTHRAAAFAAGGAGGRGAGGVRNGDAGAAGDTTIDWESTLRFREHLWAHGFGVAEAMDTAQRGMGLSWEQAQELIARSAGRARQRGGTIAAGVGTDQLTGGESHPIAAIIAAYEEQLDAV